MDKPVYVVPISEYYTGTNPYTIEYYTTHPTTNVGTWTIKYGIKDQNGSPIVNKNTNGFNLLASGWKSGNSTGFGWIKEATNLWTSTTATWSNSVWIFKTSNTTNGGTTGNASYTNTWSGLSIRCIKN